MDAYSGSITRIVEQCCSTDFFAIAQGLIGLGVCHGDERNRGELERYMQDWGIISITVNWVAIGSSIEGTDPFFHGSQYI
jgi:hypothetical protein